MKEDLPDLEKTNVAMHSGEGFPQATTEASSQSNLPAGKINWKKALLITAIAVIVLAAGVAGYYFLYPQETKKIATQTLAPESEKDMGGTLAAAPTPTPIPLKPDNGTKGTYLISQTKNGGPMVKQVIFDPLDIKKG